MVMRSRAKARRLDLIVTSLLHLRRLWLAVWNLLRIPENFWKQKKSANLTSENC